MADAQFRDDDEPKGSDELSDDELYEKFFSGEGARSDEAEDEGGEPEPPPREEPESEPAGEPEPDPEPAAAADGERPRGPDGRFVKKEDAGEPDPGAAPERDYKTGYENLQVALRESREREKEMRDLLKQVSARTGGDERGKRAPAKPARPRDATAGMPKIDPELLARVEKGDYKDALQELQDTRRLGAEQAKVLAWFASQMRGDAERRARESEEDQRRTEADSQRSEFIQAVTREVGALIPEDRRTEFSDAFNAVLKERAIAIYESPMAQAYLSDPRYTEGDIQEWALQQAHLGLHQRAAQMLRAQQDPVEGIWEMAKRSGWRPPAAIEAEKTAAEQAAAEKAKAEKAKADAAKREKAREVLSTSLSTTGQSNGGGVQTPQDLGAVMDQLNGQEFSDQFDRLFGYKR